MFTPLASDKMAAMPMMPMEPAKAVMSVRPFFVSRFLNERESAVAGDMRVVRACLAVRGASVSVAGSKGRVSARMTPSANVTMRVAYCSASSGLCVTMMTRRSLAISVSRSMICTLVLLSSAPVGSSASRISGSLMSARAMATRCIWPPESWLGFLCTWSASPTRPRASMARRRRSARPMPDRVSASSTFSRMV